MTRTIVVGSSIGGVRTAQALRSEGYDGEIILVGEERELPYNKPPLSKELLAGTATADSIRLLTERSAEAAGIQMLLGHRATRIDVASAVVEVQNHESLRYDHLVVATGSRARPSPWGEQPGLHVVRTLPDAQRLSWDLQEGGDVVVIGGGFIGAEVASTARVLGLAVTLVDPLPVPMSRVLNEEIGQWFVDLHERHGVRSLLGVGVETVGSEREGLRIMLTDGTILRAATAVVGIGAVPNDGWLRTSGLTIDDGLVCDRYCRALGAVNVYAVGDVARWFHPRHGIDVRVEHWTNAVDQALCVAHNIVHQHDIRAYAPVEYVWSDQHDWRLQVVGQVGGNAEHVLVGNPRVNDRFVALYTDDGHRLSGAAVVNWPRGLIECRRAIKLHARLSEVRHRLAAQVCGSGRVSNRS